MPIYKYGAAGFFKRLKSFAEDTSGSSKVEQIVTDILRSIEQGSDRALFQVTERLDGAKLTPKTLKVTEA